MLQTETIEWGQFKERFAFLLAEMTPALRGIDDETIAFRTEEFLAGTRANSSSSITPKSRTRFIPATTKRRFW